MGSTSTCYNPHLKAREYLSYKRKNEHTSVELCSELHDMSGSARHPNKKSLPSANIQ